MVEETGNPMNMQAVEEEYEYEYIELAEGEEVPEGAEYEYEYVEVPAEEILAAAEQAGYDTGLQDISDGYAVDAENSQNETLSSVETEIEVEQVNLDDGQIGRAHV